MLDISTKLVTLDGLTRDEVVPFYVGLIESNAPHSEIVGLHRFIRAKWSVSAITYIKNKAWNLAFSGN